MRQTEKISKTRMTISGENSNSTINQENGPSTMKLTYYLTTVAVLLECITFGCAFNMFGPLLVELKNKYETDIDYMSNIFVVLTFSYLVGALVGGVVYGKLIKRQNGVAIVFIGISLSLFATPYCPTITHLFIVVACIGFTTGAYDTAQTVWIMEMWQDKAGPYLQAQHFCFAFGSVLPSLLTAPFLSSGAPTGNDTVITTASDNVSITAPIHEFSSVIPFSIVGGMAAMNVFYELFLITCFPYVAPERESLLEETTSRDSDDDGLDQQNEIKGGVIGLSDKVDKDSKITESRQDLPPTPLKSNRVKLVICAGLFLGFYQGMEMVSLQFITTLAQYGKSKLSGAEAAQLLTGLSGAFAGGRALGILMALKVSSQVILSFNLLLVILGNAILLLWAHLGLSTPFLWAAVIILGLGFSTTYASFCAFMARHLIFTDFIGCVMLVSGSIVGMIYPAIVGKFVEHHPEVVTYTNFTSAALCTAAFLMVVYFVTRKSKSDKNQPELKS